ncbi:uncharacterized protein A4U43_UnF1620 [Asparagus officinalis]|uniref:Uncharacterized protein n=2 Tax=Asparagus officinalis TaxID=4686 RepID=A0A1R3L7H2_ASPOF|nr:uncharacterized protein A4U43_UnF1620 [Asparagus officinalis]
MDFSNLNFSPSQEDPYPPPPPPPPPKPLEEEEEQQEKQGERFGVVLSRNCSSSSQRFKGSSNASTLQGVARRAFSMRKSSSVGDGYWRIHDEDGDHGHGEVIHEEEPIKIKKRGKLFRACKRLFRF